MKKQEPIKVKTRASKKRIVAIVIVSLLIVGMVVTPLLSILMTL